MRDKHGHAVIVGGSMAGLLAARALSPHFERVTLVERDGLSDVPDPRKGVPQARHVHALLARGEEILSGLFPGLVPELVDAGAVRIDWTRDVKWFHFGAWKARCDSGVMTTLVSRPFLELSVRRRVLALPNVKLVAEHDVTGLTASPDRQRVTGVLIQRRDADGGAEALSADLTVDTSGRGSRTPQWLEALGYAAPEESAVKINVGYASRIYRVPDDAGRGWKGCYVLGTPPHGKRLGVVAPIEGGRWMVTLAGMARDYPPDDHAGYLEFASSLPVDDIHRAIKDAEPLSDVAAYRFSSNLRRHYERMKRAPEGFVVLGDASCSFNPIYGQGMTTAGLGALALDACLSEQRSRGSALDGFARRFQKKLAAATDVPWSMTTGEDFRFPETEGKRPLGGALLERYLTRVHVSSARDTKVLLAFTRAMHMLAGPTELLAPRMMLRVLRASGSR
jgi:2-polyprenyl-6-methoxyphenol hydroxylase-like FAD-dependent oxidoreductase